MIYSLLVHSTDAAAESIISMIIIYLIIILAIPVSALLIWYFINKKNKKH